MADYVGYVRVSSKGGRGGESFISPEEQVKKIRGSAQTLGHDIVEVFEDIDVSGGSMDRPGFNEMMALLEAGGAQGVIVSKITRFSRTLIGALDAIERLDKLKVDFVAVDDKVDRTTDTGRMMFGLLLVLAEFERDRMKTEWASNLRAVIARGVWPMQPPYGYVKGENKKLYPHPEERKAVEAIFRLRAKGEPWSAIADWLTKNSYKPPRSTLWVGNSIRDMVTNRAYLGIIEKGEFRNESAHTPLVTPAQWRAAQNVNAIQRSSNKDGDGQLLSGLIRCASCSYTVRASSYGKAGTLTRQYNCKPDHGSGRCPSPVAVNATTIEPYVIERFFEYIGSPEVHAENERHEDVEAAESALADADALLAEYRDNLGMQATLGLQGFLEGLQTRVAARDAAADRLGQVRRRHAVTELPDAVELREVWDDLGVRDQRRLLSAAMDCVMLRKGRGDIENRARILWKGQAPEGLSRKGRSVPIREYAFD